MIVRTWPKEQAPAYRARIVDEYPRLCITGFDLATAPDLEALLETEDRVTLIEWDVAVAFPDLMRMDHHKASIVVAPYLLYPCSTQLKESVYAHRVGADGTRWVTEKDSFADHVGFGCISLDSEYLRDFLRQRPTMHDPRLTDTNFSHWFYAHHQGCIPILWDVKAVHLHDRAHAERFP